MATSKAKQAELQQERDHARATLLKMLTPGDTIYTKLDHVSRSGMFRCISLYIGSKDGKGDITDITYYAARVLDDKISAKHSGIEVGGCGMDMGFHLVYNLSSVLYRAGEGFKADPAAMARFNERAKYPAHSDDPGYLLSQRWL